MAGFGLEEGNRNPLPRAGWWALVARAFTAGGKFRSDPADRAWARSILTAAEFELWARQSRYDRGHAMQVARRVERRLATTPFGADTLWSSAALMHDVGKIQSDLSLVERVAATLASKVVGIATARRWAGRTTGWKGRLGRYLTHAELGASMIRAAGGREEIAAWTEAHQDVPTAGVAGIPPVVVAALVDSDVA